MACARGRDAPARAGAARGGGTPPRQLAGVDVDVVVLDVHVGRDNGIEFLQELRRDRPDLKVAMLTGAENVGTIGSDGVIPKPFTIEQLTSTVANLAG